MSEQRQHDEALDAYMDEVRKLFRTLADSEARRQGARIMEDAVEKLKELNHIADEGETTDEDREGDTADGGTTSSAAAAAATMAEDTRRPAAAEQTQEFGDEDEESPILKAKPAQVQVPPLEADTTRSGGILQATLPYENEDDAMGVDDGSEDGTGRKKDHAQTLAYDDEEDEDAAEEANSRAKCGSVGGAETQAYGDDDDGEETQDESERREGSERDERIETTGEEVEKADTHGVSAAPMKSAEGPGKGGAAGGRIAHDGGGSKSPARVLPAWATGTGKGKSPAATPASGIDEARVGAPASRVSTSGGSAAKDEALGSADEVSASRGEQGAGVATARQMAAGKRPDGRAQGVSAGSCSRRANGEMPAPSETPRRGDDGESASLQSVPGSAQSVVYGASPPGSRDQEQATLMYESATDDAQAASTQSAAGGATLVYDPAGGGEEKQGCDKTLTYEAPAKAGALGGPLGATEEEAAADGGVAANTLAYESAPEEGRLDGATLPYETGGMGGLGGATLTYDSGETGGGGADDATMQYDVAGVADAGSLAREASTLDYHGPPQPQPKSIALKSSKLAEGSSGKGSMQEVSKTSEKVPCAWMQAGTQPYDAMPSNGPAGTDTDATLAYDEGPDGGALATLTYEAAAPGSVSDGAVVATLPFDADAGPTAASKAQTRERKATAAPGGRAGKAKGQSGKAEQAEHAAKRSNEKDAETLADGNLGDRSARAGRRVAQPASAVAADVQASGSKRGRSGRAGLAGAVAREGDAGEHEGRAEVEDSLPHKKQKRGGGGTDSAAASACGAARAAAKDKGKARAIPATAGEGEADTDQSRSDRSGPETRVAILISGIQDKKLEAQITRLEGSIETEPDKCTHLITEHVGKGKDKRLKYTAKMLAVLGMGGRPVVDRKWAEESSRKKMWLPVQPYLIRDEQNSGFDLTGGTGGSGSSGGRGVGAGRKREEGGVFKSLCFFRMDKFEFTKGDCEMVIKAAGGQVVQEKREITSATIVLAGEEDFKKFGKNKKPPWTPATEVQKKDFIKFSILNQKLDREAYRW